MSRNPDTHEILDITGPEGETLFWHAKAWLLGKQSLQQHLDETWAHYKDIHDHRLLALVAGLCVERSIDALLLSFAPGFDNYQEDLDFTFSIKIKVARTLRLLPSRLLTNCDLIRQIRNEFAHHLDYKEFQQLDERKFRNKLLPYVIAFNAAKRNESDHKQLFKELVGFTLMALHVYTQQLDQLRRYITTPDSQELFKQWVENSTP